MEGIVKLKDNNNVMIKYNGEQTEIYDKRNVLIGVIEDTYESTKQKLQELDKFELIELFTRFYDWENDYSVLMQTYMDDIIIGNGYEVVEKEIKEIENDLKSLNEDDFCKTYNIIQINETYFKL